MILSINPVNFTANPEKKTKISKEKKEDIREGVVAGGAAGAGYKAAKSNGMKMLKEAEAASKAGKAAAAVKAAETAKKSKGLFAGLKNNANVLTKRFVTQLENIKASKYIKPIINNRITRFGCGIFGGFLAGCILVSGIGTLYHNTTKIVDHYVPRVANRVNNLVDYSEKRKKELSVEKN